jgi:hypothetical protein
MSIATLAYSIHQKPYITNEPMENDDHSHTRNREFRDPRQGLSRVSGRRMAYEATILSSMIPQRRVDTIKYHDHLKHCVS